MNLDYVKKVNKLFTPFYPYIARQILQEYGRNEGRVLEIGPYSSGISFALLRLCQGLKITIGDENKEVLEYLKNEIENSGFAENISIEEIDKYSISYPDNTFDLIYFRGALFFWEYVERIIKETFRVLRQNGTGFIGGGFGKDTPSELIERHIEKTKEINKKLGKKVLSRKELEEIIDKSGLKNFSRIDDKHGLWVVLKK